MSSEKAKINLTGLLESRYGKLESYAKSLWKDQGDYSSQDILQDVLANLSEKSDISLSIEELLAYAYRSIRNRIVDLLRKKKIQTQSMDAPLHESGISLVDCLPDISHDPLEYLERKESLVNLEKALSQLNDDDRLVVIETELHRIPISLLAQEWEEPLGTLTSRKKRALKKLKKILKQMEEEYVE